MLVLHLPTFAISIKISPYMPLDTHGQCQNNHVSSTNVTIHARAHTSNVRAIMLVRSGQVVLLLLLSCSSFDCSEKCNKKQGYISVRMRV